MGRHDAGQDDRLVAIAEQERSPNAFIHNIFFLTKKKKREGGREGAKAINGRQVLFRYYVLFITWYTGRKEPQVL